MKKIVRGFKFKVPNFQFLNGQSLIEVLIALGLASILLPAVLTGLVASREGKAQEGQRLISTSLLKEAEEVTRSVREKGWGSIPASSGSPYHPQATGTSWSLISGAETVSGFTRRIDISDVFRDLGGNIVTSGGTLDPSTKKIVSTVSWSTPIASQVDSTFFLSRYLNNNTWTQTTQADFNAGSHNSTKTVATGDGAVELDTATTTSDYGNKFLLTATSAIGNMTSSNHQTSLRFSAQATKTVNAIRVYLHSEVGASPTYRYGIQADSSGLPSGAYLGSGTLNTNSGGWKTITLSPSVNITAGNTYHIVVQYNSGNISTSRFVALRRSTPQNLLYPQTQAADPQANTLFTTTGTFSAASIQNFQPIYELDFSDSTFEGNPYEGNTENSVFGPNWYSEKFTISPQDKTAQSISFCIRKNGTPPADLQVELRNAADTSLYTGTLSTSATAPTSYTCPTSWQTHTFSPSPITLTAGTTYRIILKSPSSTSTDHYRFNSIFTTNAANFNSITYDGTSSVYSSSTNSGGNWTDSNQSDVAGFYFTIQNPGASNGDFTSQSFDAGTTVAFNNVTWSASVIPSTTLELQVSTDGGSTFFGPDGTAGAKYTQPGAIPLTKILGQNFKFKAFLTGDGSNTPTLLDVTVNYSP